MQKTFEKPWRPPPTPSHFHFNKHIFEQCSLFRSRQLNLFGEEVAENVDIGCRVKLGGIALANAKRAFKAVNKIFDNLDPENSRPPLVPYLRHKATFQAALEEAKKHYATQECLVAASEVGSISALGENPLIDALRFYKSETNRMVYEALVSENTQDRTLAKFSPEIVSKAVEEAAAKRLQRAGPSQASQNPPP